MTTVTNAVAGDTPLRIAVLIPRYYPIFGGAENQARLLNRTLAMSGAVEIAFVLTKRVTSDVAAHERVDGIAVRRIGSPGNEVWRWYVWYFEAAGHLLRHRSDYDVVHCHATSVVGFLAAVAGKIAGRPVILKISSNGELFKGTGVLKSDSVKRRIFTWARGIVARLIGRLSTIVALNNEGLHEARQTGTRHAVLIPNGIDESMFRPVGASEREALRQQMGFAPSDRVFLFVGRFTAGKGIEILLDAVAEVAAEDPHVRVGLVGSANLQAEAVEVDQSLRPGIITIFPPRMPPADYYRAADAFVFPSRREGMPNVVLEALAAGLPCLLSDIAPHRELRDQNPAAAIELFRDGDAHDLARLIRSAATSPLPIRAPALSPLFDIRSVAASYVALYRSLACGK